MAKNDQSALSDIKKQMGQLGGLKGISHYEL